MLDPCRALDCHRQDCFGAYSTLAKVKAVGHLACGINREEPEYSNLDAHGNRALFDVDVCKATAVAILGPGARFDVTAFLMNSPR